MKRVANGANMQSEQAWNILNSAELICSAESINKAVDQLAAAISTDLREHFPLVLTVMKGGMMFSGHLLSRLHFPLSCDYIHATRYQNTTQGSTIDWLALPSESVAQRHVLLLDDILDEGQTLAAIKTRLLDMGALSVVCAVLTDKMTGETKPIKADYVGMQLPNRYVFGYGMDIQGVWRNLPAIYAIKEPDHPTQTN